MPKSILIVDDEPEILEMLSMQFEDEKWDVSSSLNGSEASTLIDKNTFDVILSDIQMPIMNGVDLIKSINHKDLSILVFFMTGFSDFSRDELIALGAQEIFKKPFSIGKVSKEIFQAYSLKQTTPPSY